jgi:replication-associated recombination protein RarA
MSGLFAVEKQESLGFPESLTSAYQPQTINEFCGLEKIKKILSALARNPRSCGMVFEGGPGTGKTSMAYAFAREILAEIHHIPSADCKLETLQGVSAMCHRVPYDFTTGKTCKFHAVIVDEGDLMSSQAQNYLLSKLDGTEPCPTTVWIFTCNSTERFEERFLSRCEIKLKFNSYGAGQSVRSLLSRIWKERAGDAPEPDYESVPTGNVREALQWLEVELLAAEPVAA